MTGDHFPKEIQPTYYEKCLRSAAVGLARKTDVAVFSDLVEADFRITTNGEEFRVEKRELRGILWWKKWAWCEVWTGDPDRRVGVYSPIDRYKTYGEAKAFLKRCARRDIAEKRGWNECTNEEKK